MKFAFISDIHGNAVALEAVLQDIERQGIDKTIVLGDISYRGPEPKRALELVRSLSTDVIKGNADEWIIRGVRSGEVPDSALELMNIEREWALNKLDPRDIEYLKSLPHHLNLNVGNVNIHVFHATPTSLFDIISPDADDLLIEDSLMSHDAQLFVYGHIHVPYIRYLKGKVIINTGSVGLPFDGLAKASYAIVEVVDGRIRTSIERVDYNKERVLELYQEAGYPNAEMMKRIIVNGAR
ncbi:YfcE family phosphodiesterase [Anaerobacillus sp. CMMVII]|uniref:metallophosphoesterase family protein n=1 Tax=Anaerobacillus sp. CMMVII TaxID=2755588 RepID=UPI0021B84443|nr:YfcE family phosphodiesterase [Anaerobacillus sp. CMMVII]MCT8138468.1 YfcE family phosphodiesterase [Anaerobacillus sp. CMMVII]